MDIAFLLERFHEAALRPAIISAGRSFTYAWLLEAMKRWDAFLDKRGITHSLVSLEADFSPESVALLLALIQRSCIIVPLTTSVEAHKPAFRELAQAEVVIQVNAGDEVTCEKTGTVATHQLYGTLRSLDHAGLILFSSGSTGTSKAAVHDLAPLLEKFKLRRKSRVMLSFLLFDHIGGVNTLLYTLSNGGCLVTVAERSPDAVAAAIEQFRVEVLPASPTFLNLLLLSEAHTRRDLSSLQVVTYGTEVMPQSTLDRLRAALPSVELQQTYGLSEVGILRSKSRSSDSLFMRVGGETFQTRVVEGLLEVKATSAMLGYLNAPSPFTEDGWFRTGDAVEVDGEYIRILGRREEIINVGGEKVYPAEVESVLQSMDGVADAAVTGEPNAITGHMVTARVALTTAETAPEFRARMREFCKDKLARFKVPQKVTLVAEPMHGARFKKMRND